MPMHGTPLLYDLTERATHDQIPLRAIDLERSDAADGRVFPYVFTTALMICIRPAVRICCI